MEFDITVTRFDAAHEHNMIVAKTDTIANANFIATAYSRSDQGRYVWIVEDKSSGYIRTFRSGHRDVV